MSDETVVSELVIRYGEYAMTINGNAEEKRQLLEEILAAEAARAAKGT
jgi:hypothetical protein